MTNDLLKMVRYVFLRPQRPELDVEASSREVHHVGGVDEQATSQLTQYQLAGRRLSQKRTLLYQ
jgi:hypothetical protein